MRALRDGRTSQPSIAVRELALPAGGGAIRGMDDAFAANEFSGSATLTIALPVTPARGLHPLLRLEYDSLNGNGPFGAGFAASIPFVSRRMTHVPRYDDGDDLQLSSAGPLTEVLESAATATLDGIDYDVVAYRPHVDGTFARIEWWRAADGTESFWRVISVDNRSQWFGRSAGSRIANPARPSQIFQWLLDTELDARGNAIVYRYVPEDTQNVPHAIFERNRVQTAMRYPDRVLYGNATPVTAPADAHALADEAWHFAVVFDYGQYFVAPENDEPFVPVRAWTARADPFSTYFAGFEIRTHRLCRNVLLFHRFPEIGSEPVLTRVVALAYDESPAMAMLTSAQTSGWQYDGSRSPGQRYRTKSLPRMTLGYVPFRPGGHSFEPLAIDGDPPPSSLERAPFYSFVDLYGDGIPGVLYADERAAIYWDRKMGVSPAEIGFGPPSPIDFPLGGTLTGGRSLIDLDANGRMDVMVVGGGIAGAYEMRPDARFGPFWPFSDFPTTLDSAALEYCDLTGDGWVDALQVERTSVTWYESAGLDGFAPARVVPASDLPITADDSARAIVGFADLLGAGTPQRVRISSGRVECWPSLGYGRFAAKIELAHAPAFGPGVPASAVFMADVDGSGTADLVIAHADRIEIYVNHSGNAFATEPIVIPLPGRLDSTASRILFADAFGIGCDAAVFTRRGPGPTHVAYDFCQRRKPYLLERVENGVGAVTTIEYASTTHYALEDKRNGVPWLTRLPFPMHVVQRTTTDDPISETHTAVSFAYHDGYYDSYDGEFRGFAMVERVETRAADSLGGFLGTIAVAGGTPAQQPPTMTKRWFLTGWTADGALAEIYRRTYFPGDPDVNRVPLAVIDWNDLPHDGETLRQAWNASAGSMVHEEVYGLDGTALQPVPYIVRDNSYRIQLQQPNDADDYRHHAIFTVHAREALEYTYERVAGDPRTRHTFTLDVDGFGNLLESCTIWYPRRAGGVDGQTTVRALGTRNAYVPALVTDDALVADAIADVRHIELTNLPPPAVDRRYYSVEQIAEAMSDHPGPVAQALTRRRSFFYVAEDGGEAPPGTITPQKLLVRVAQLAFDDATLARQYEGVLTPAELAGLLTEDGGYVLVDGEWWDPGSAQTYLGAADFHLPSAIADPFARAALRQGGATTTYDWDPHRLIVTRLTTTGSKRDVLDSRRSIERMDYQAMQALQIADENGVIEEAIYDPLGFVLVRSQYGRERAGTTIERVGFTALDFARQWDWPQPASLSDLVADPATYVRGAKAFFFYDVDAFARQGTPVVSVKATAQAYPDPRHPDRTVGDVQIELQYVDGVGRTVQRSVKTEPGPGAIGPRWLVSARTRYNSAANPFRIYEPFYAATAEFIPNDEVSRSSVSPTFFFDALDRVVRTEYPRRPFDDAFFGKTVHTPWSLIAYDVNDTITDSVYYRYFIVEGHPLPANEKDALVKAAAFADTPQTTVYDVMGRTVEVRACLSPDGEAPPLVTRNAFDIEGDLLWSSDPRLFDAGVRNVEDAYGLTANKVRSISCDRGTIHHLSNLVGRLIFSRDARGTIVRPAYDSFHRPCLTRVTAGAAERVAERTIYGDSLDPDGHTPYGNDEGLNVRGEIVVRYDQAGREETGTFTITGQPLARERRVTTAFESAPAWDAAGWTAWAQLFADLDPQLEVRRYTDSATYDALARPVTLTDQAGNVLGRDYFVSGRLDRTRWTPAGGSPRTYVTGTSYDPRDRPLLIGLGDRQSATFAETAYVYDPDTTHLISHVTTALADGRALQNLQYWYDPAGNLTYVQDAAAPLGAVFHDNQFVTADRGYTFDALYRLTAATGRALKGLTRADERSGGYAPFFRPPRADPSAVERYTTTYEYDGSSNLHRVRFASQTSTFAIDVTIDGTSNRGAELDEHTQLAEYFDAAGNQIRLGALRPIVFDDRNNIAAVTLVKRAAPFEDAAYYVYDGDGMRLRTVTRTLVSGQEQTEEVLTFAALEIYRRTLGGVVVEERQRARILHRDACIAERLLWTLGDPPSGVPNDQHRYQFGDDQGVALETDDAANLISYEEYAPYGATTYAAGPSLVDVDLKEYRYSGEQRDKATGLYYYGARYAIPWCGRWMTPDPAGFVDGLNLYAFAGDNPVVYADAGGYGRRKKPPAKVPAPSSSTSTTSTAAKSTKKRKHEIGSHGYKKKEQQRLLDETGFEVTGDTHESEHSVGFEPLSRGVEEKRGKGKRARKLENEAPAYQEYKPLHRDHIGTGTKSKKDESGFNSQTYRDSQRAFLEKGDVNTAVQLNQLGYAFDKRFNPPRKPNAPPPPTSLEMQAADNSYDAMVKNLKTFTYATGSTDTTITVSAEDQLDMHMARRVSRTGQYPTAAEILEARPLFGLPLIPPPPPPPPVFTTTTTTTTTS